MLTYDDLIKRFTDWADQTQDVRGALMIGSSARSDHPADEWSDLDLLVFANNPGQFIQSSEWAVSIAPCWLTFAGLAPDGKSWERRTLYQGGLDVDLDFNPEELLDGILMGMPPEVADILRRGVEVLVDKDGKLNKILHMPLPEMTLFQKPTAQEFVNDVSNFWYHTLWSAKHLLRGELWWAKSCVDMYLKELLRKMLEWHAHATKGKDIDTWLRGRFLEEWADPRAVEQLRDAFAHYDIDDIAYALQVTMDLYRWLEDETASRWGYQTSLEGEHQAAEAAKQLLDKARLEKEMKAER